jgi:hypothetical protein
MMGVVWERSSVTAEDVRLALIKRRCRKKTVNLSYARPPSTNEQMMAGRPSVCFRKTVCPKRSPRPEVLSSINAHPSPEPLNIWKGDCFEHERLAGRKRKSEYGGRVIARGADRPWQASSRIELDGPNRSLAAVHVRWNDSLAPSLPDDDKRDDLLVGRRDGRGIRVWRPRLALRDGGGDDGEE